MTGTEQHYDCDVVVVGFGCAGAAAAYEAAAAGADVIVLERASGPGGSAAQSGGEIYLGGGTGVQRACGFDDDDADNMFAYLKAALGPHADEEKLRLYCDGSLEHFEWFRARGVEFQETFYESPGWMAPTKDGLMWLGENAWPYNTVARAVPRGHRPPAPLFAGGILMEKLAAAVAAAGAVTHTDTRATDLIADETGRTIGVTARKFGEDVTYTARRGVIITTGGFVDNDEMLAEHALDLVGHGKVSDGLDDGSGILMAQRAGAATRRMASVQIALLALPAAVARGMLVNALGQRFINEDVYPGMFSEAAVRHQPAPYWAIIDEKGYEDIPAEDLWGVRPKYAAETLAELEEELGMPAGALESTVEAYNRYAEKGEDPYFHKDPKWLRPLTGPWAALDPRDGFFGLAMETGANGFTLGGLHTTIDGAVLDHAGQPIKGLYAAGRAAAAMHGDGYVSGTSIGDGTFFGRRAGKSAAAETPAEDTPAPDTPAPDTPAAPAQDTPAAETSAEEARA